MKGEEISGHSESASSKDSVLSRKLSKLLSSESNLLDSDPDMAVALCELSTFFEENTLHSRRFLRGQIERRMLDEHKRLLSELGSVEASVSSVNSSFRRLSEECGQLSRQLSETQSKTKELIQRSHHMAKECEDIEEKEAFLDNLIKEHQLEEKEVEILTRNDVTMVNDPAFFGALSHARSIHAKCRLQAAPFFVGITAQMNQVLQRASETLYKWCISQVSSTSSSLQRNLPEALSFLQETQPSLFDFVLDEALVCRKSGLVRAFLDALTKGSESSKPIEVQAHDPVRYVGDMLAFIHQAIPDERQFFEALLRECKKIGMRLPNLVASSTDDVCRPLQSRVEQIIITEVSPLIAFKLHNLLTFYSTTILKSLQQTSSLVDDEEDTFDAKQRVPLVTTLNELMQLGWNHFVKVLSAAVNQQTTQNVMSIRLNDLAVDSSVLNILHLLKELLSNASSSASLDDDKDNKVVQEVISTLLDPLLSHLEGLANSLSSVDADVFMLNALYQMKLSLSLFQYTESRLHSIEKDIQLRLDTLSSEQTSHVIAELGLQPLCTLIASKKPNNERSVTLEDEGVSAFLNRFDRFLVAPDSLFLPQTKMLVSSGHRKQVAQRSLQVVSASYSQIYAAIAGGKTDEVSDEKGITFARRRPEMKTPEQVELLLQL